MWNLDRLAPLPRRNILLFVIIAFVFYTRVYATQKRQKSGAQKDVLMGKCTSCGVKTFFFTLLRVFCTLFAFGWVLHLGFFRDLFGTSSVKLFAAAMDGKTRVVYRHI